MTRKYAVLSAWLLTGLVVVICFFAWGASYQWQLASLSSYQLFPLLGLWAFTIMWCHYMMVAVRSYWSLDQSVLASYFRLTGYTVLILICLHPGLLAYARFRNGFGLPPHSYETYVAPGLGWITLLGTAALLVFLAFELHRFFRQKSWWHWVADASDLAMLAIAYHSLRLGTTLILGWFRAVWYFFVITLILSLVYKYYRRWH